MPNPCLELPPDFNRDKQLSLTRRRLRELVNPFEVLTPWWQFDVKYDRWEDVPQGWHYVEMTSLLNQLHRAIGDTTSSAGRGSGFESKTPAVDDAIVLEQRIIVESAKFLRTGIGRTPTGDVVRDLSEIHRLSPGLTDVGVCELRRLVHSWWLGCQVHGGLGAPPYRPHAKCPICGTQDSLRLRMTSQDLGVGHCAEPQCGAAWDADEFGLLLRSIFEETGLDPWAGASDRVYHELRRHSSRQAAQERDGDGRAHWCSMCEAWHPGRPRRQGAYKPSASEVLR